MLKRFLDGSEARLAFPAVLLGLCILGEIMLYTWYLHSRSRRVWDHALDWETRRNRLPMKLVILWFFQGYFCGWILRSRRRDLDLLFIIG